MASLVGDSETEEAAKKQVKMSEFARGLPPTINKKLKAAIIEFDLLGDSFTWLKDGSEFYLKACGGGTLKIRPTSHDRYEVILSNGKETQVIAQDLNFEYAFSSAEEYAKENRSQFIISDLDATWRQQPISEKQKKVFQSYRYRSGIDDLTKGQASLIISSGILNKKAVGG
jgi:hypothetical protein